MDGLCFGEVTGSDCSIARTAFFALLRAERRPSRNLISKFDNQVREEGAALSMVTAPMLRTTRMLDGLLRCGLGCVDRQAQLALGRAQVVLGPGSVPFHVVVIRGTGVLHLVDGFRDVFVNGIKITPVAYLRRQRGASNERHGESRHS